MSEARLQRQLGRQGQDPAAESAVRGGAGLDAILAEIVGALENVRGVLAHAVENFPKLDHGGHLAAEVRHLDGHSAHVRARIEERSN